MAEKAKPANITSKWFFDNVYDPETMSLRVKTDGATGGGTSASTYGDAVFADPATRKGSLIGGVTETTNLFTPFRFNSSGELKVDTQVNIENAELEVNLVASSGDNVGMFAYVGGSVLQPVALAANAAQELMVTDVPNQPASDGVLELTTTPREGYINETTLPNRKYVEMQALTAGVKWGYTENCPFDLFKNQFFSLPAGTNCKVYFKAAAGTASVAIAEK